MIGGAWWFPDWFDQTFRYFPASMGMVTSEPFDVNNPDAGTAYFWKPISIPSRVEVKVRVRQDNHWPAVGTIYRFGPGQTYAYNTQNEVHHWSGGGQNTWLWLTVNTDGTIRYRANDADFGNG